MTTWVLAIDFGTTNTVASVGDDSGVRTLNVDGRPVMPSAVFLERLDRPGSAESWTVGERAVHLARRRLEQFEANPKKCVADGTLFLGGRDVPVGDAIAALLAPIVDEAASQYARQPPAVVLVTHPASWAGPRVEILRQAVRSATQGRRWPEPFTLAEPVAAAQRTLHAPDIADHARLVVLDFGGGTVDVSVVDRHDATVTVVGRPVGLESLGGEDFDMRLAAWMCDEIGLPGLFQHLAASPDPDRQERAVELRAHARILKEELSKRTVVHGQVYRSPPELPETVPVQVNRNQLEQLIGGGPGREPGLAEAVGLVDHAMRGAPPGPPFGGVFLVGGSSRISRLGVLVVERTGRPPIMHGDPTTAVSDGAAQYGLRQVRGRAHHQAPAGPVVASSEKTTLRS
ncbi:Hsp70 family protein [Paractinoplanes maris]|uniref:Hsp70 family protein n=1 Tax=Paractinoplanes maris TaxID=1734446 RepID=UPI0020208FBC|nr:Hsp70 family protein [Actinoplanes maris]